MWRKHITQYEKNSRRPEQIFVLRKHTNGQQMPVKILSIAHHLGNANQNHNEISPHTCHHGYHQKDKKLQVLERMWKKGSPMPCGENVNWCSHWENRLETPQRVKIQLTRNHIILILRSRNINLKNMCTAKFIATLFRVARDNLAT